MKSSSSTQIIRTEDGRLLGLLLEADFTSEHEWGVKELNTACGVDTRKIGLEGRAITRTDAIYHEDGFLAIGSDVINPYRGPYTPKHAEYALKGAYAREGWKSAWDEKNLVATAEIDLGDDWLKPKKKVTQEMEDALKERKALLAELSEHLKNGDGVILYGNRLGFKRGGLMVAIKSRFSPEEAEELRAADQDYLDLQAEKAKVGIEEFFRKHGRKFFALSPRWASEHSGIATEHKVVFWLNGYHEPALNHQPFGYYSVEDLREYAEHFSGKVVEDAKTYKAKYATK